MNWAGSDERSGGGEIRDGGGHGKVSTHAMKSDETPRSTTVKPPLPMLIIQLLLLCCAAHVLLASSPLRHRTNAG